MNVDEALRGDQHRYTSTGKAQFSDPHLDTVLRMKNTTEYILKWVNNTVCNVSTATILLFVSGKIISPRRRETVKTSLQTETTLHNYFTLSAIYILDPLSIYTHIFLKSLHKIN